MGVIFVLLHTPDGPSNRMTSKDKLRQLNALGLLALLPENCLLVPGPAIRWHYVCCEFRAWLMF